MLPLISAIVVTKNNAKTIEKCITSLLNQNYPKERYEIVFVDGHSIDGTDELIKKYAKTRQFLRLYYENCGTIGYARNLGISKSKGDIIVFIDGDAYAPKNWIEKIVDTFQNDEGLAIVGGLDILASNSRITSSYSVMDSWRRLKKAVGIKAIPCIKAVNFAIRRNVALACNGFDSSLSYWEEPEFMARLYVKMKIAKILYDPEIFVYHERRLLGSALVRVRKIFRKSMIGAPVFLRKHMIKVALASPMSPHATSFYMILACVVGAPLLVFLTLNGLLLSTLKILLILYLSLVGIYTLYASMRTKKFALVIPLTLTFDCVIRLAGTFFGLIKVVIELFSNSCPKRRSNNNL